MMPILSGIGCFFLYGCSVQEARAWDWGANCRRRSNRGAGGKGRAQCSRGGVGLVCRGGMIAGSGLRRVGVYDFWDLGAEGTVGCKAGDLGSRQRRVQAVACSGAAAGAQAAGLGVWARCVASKEEQKRAGQGEQSKGDLGNGGLGFGVMVGLGF
ncbi:hypothetical protein SLEP1_g53335 [Rubroshorea leprosula]|uniref:Uncharacterized protein n=1 Tax=Rubroshorea leprosula TaxID=152421 RepID=A0AAV5M9Z9_9ROSI|nr:hypothetical protein SLEP1_g53335 [Rubroshorea leprosula]